MNKLKIFILPFIFTPTLYAQTGYEKQIFDRVNATRVAAGLPMFIWDSRLNKIAREAVASNSAYHQGFASRIARQGFNPDYSSRYIAEGSFPADYGLEGILSMMKGRMRQSRHAQDFFNPTFRSFGCAYGGQGDEGKPFYVFVYLK